MVSLFNGTSTFVGYVCLFGFDGILTFDRYLMPNQFYTN